MSRLVLAPFTRLAIGTMTLIAAIVAARQGGDNTLIGVLLGAGIVLVSDGLSDVAAHRSQIHDDLDETRRLLYMALAIRAGTAERPHDLAGTLANALIHHSKRLDRATAERLSEAIAGGGGLTGEQIDHLHKLVADVTKQMGEAIPA